jgi:hypothetical protein
MGQTSDQIRIHSEDTRQNLSSNLEELKGKIQSVTDWRGHFQNNPMAVVGLAFIGGVLVARLTRTSKGRRHVLPNESGVTATSPHAGTFVRKQQALETWDSIKGALIGVAVTEFRRFLNEMIPGFPEQFNKTESEKTKRLITRSSSESRTIL